MSQHKQDRCKCGKEEIWEGQRRVYMLQMTHTRKCIQILLINTPAYHAAQLQMDPSWLAPSDMKHDLKSLEGWLQDYLQSSGFRGDHPKWVLTAACSHMGRWKPAFAVWSFFPSAKGATSTCLSSKAVPISLHENPFPSVHKTPGKGAPTVCHVQGQYYRYTRK